MKLPVSLKIGGAAGQGVRTAGYILTKALKDLGYWTFSYSEYPSLIRGGHSTFQIDISNQKINSNTEMVDILVALNEESISKHYQEINPSGLILCDNDFEISSKIEEYLKKNNISLIKLTVDEIVKEHKGIAVMNNSVITGATWKFLTSEYEVLEEQIKKVFGDKSKNIETNLACTKGGFEYITEFVTDGTKFSNLKKLGLDVERIIGTGNEVAGLATVAAGCRVYCAYPMTPSTGILHYLAKRLKKTKMVVKQAEDEITAVQMTLGSSFTGARTACGTSGGGLALMTESLSLAGMTETPLVIFNSQRPGPATGLPTWTEQGDLDFVVHMGHGDFPRIVLAPGDIDEIFQMVPKAFNLAEKFHVPVLFLLDKHLSESWYQTEKFNKAVVFKVTDNFDGEDKVKAEPKSVTTIDRGAVITQDELNKNYADWENGADDEKKRFKRYEITQSGVSKRSLPGMKYGVYLSNSDEHDEVGYSTEDADMRNQMMEKRMRKIETIKKELPEPTLYGDKNAKITVVCWGSQKGVVIDAVAQLNKNDSMEKSNRGIKTDTDSFNVLHYSTMFPLKTEKLTELAKNEKLIIIENNYSAQFAKLVRQESGLKFDTKIMKYNGKPFFRDELVKKLGENVLE